MIHGGAKKIHGGIKKFTEGHKQFTEGPNNSPRAQIIHGAA